MNVAMYLRKSRADENNPLETLERHKEILLNYAKENGLNIIDIFEEVISGGMLYNRTEMLKLLQNVQNKKYDAVLCIDLDRLGRGSAADSEKIFDTLKQTNTKIITLKKIYDLNNEFDEDYSEFEMFMARKELKFISRRMNRGRIKSISEGGFVSGAPFGYRNAVINKKHSLVVCEEEAKYVRMIFDMYVNQGLGITAISNVLENLGVVSKKNTPLYPSSISRILKNYAYIGKIVWNKSKSVKGMKTQVKTDKSNWIYCEGLHEPIIDENIFYRAQELLEQRYLPPINHGVLKNPLSGLVKCAICGKSMVSNSSNNTKERYRLVCRTLSCNKASALSIVENKVLEQVQKELTIMEESIKQGKSNYTETEVQSYVDALDSADSELKKLEKQQIRLYDLLEQGIYTNEVFIERQKSISDRKTMLENICNEYREKISQFNNTSISERIPRFRELLNNYNNLDALDKNALLKNIIYKIEYLRKKDSRADDIFLKVYYK